jgi:hypothetical protein
MAGVVLTVATRSSSMTWFRNRYTESLETRIKVLENELRRTQDLRENERKGFERRIEDLVGRLLAKHSVPPAVVKGEGADPNALMDMDIFKDIEDGDTVDNRKGDKLDAFAG